MKNLKIISYQRNGVAGNGFYVATCTEFNLPFVVTFGTCVPTRESELESFIDRHIKIDSCRALCLTDLTEKWRGDDFADDIQKIINRRLFKLEPINGRASDIGDLIETKKCKHPSPSESGFCDDCGKFVKEVANV